MDKINQNQYFTVQNQAREKFFRVPKVFFTSEKYKSLSNDTKLAYAILQDRVELSIKNNWIDENGIIYFIYSNQNLMNILGCSEPTVIKIKKELEKVGLLSQIKQGLNKPNLLYLLKPKVKAQDYYEIENDEKEPSALEPQGTSDFKAPELKNFKSNDTDLSDTEIKKYNNDLNDMNDIYIKSQKSKKNVVEKNNDELKKYHEHKFALMPKLYNYVSNFDDEDLDMTVNLIFKAKSAFDRECVERNITNHIVTLESVEEELLACIKRFKVACVKKNEPFRAMQGYLMTSILRMLDETNAKMS